jgi:phosphoenolpyruvate carboxylase
MNQRPVYGLQQFRNHVGIKFQLYNSLFTSLPFYKIEKTGILLSLLAENCEEGYKSRKNPVEITEQFFSRYTGFKTGEEKANLLFRLVQFIERQVVLFDALEDAAFPEVTDMSGIGTLKHLESEMMVMNNPQALAEKLKTFSIRLVLTAHPTQFYPGSVLGIINDLSRALRDNNPALINMYLQQLGKTPFFNKQKPTPYDEAVSLIWYLENIFYSAAGQIASFMKERLPATGERNEAIINMGFWPGGDRDGNPNVTTEITVKVADALRSSIIKCYYQNVRRLKRRLTFKGVDSLLADLESKLYNNIFIPEQKTDLSKDDILKTLQQIREIIVYQHNGLFSSMVDDLINKVQLFGLHFAALDMRQESSVHHTVLSAIAEKSAALPEGYADLPEEERMKVLTQVTQEVAPEAFEEPLVADTLRSVQAVKTIQQFNGPEGCHRYIISQCNSALNVLEVYGLFLLGGWKKEALPIDIVPLFETIDDLKRAPNIMESLYQHPDYAAHLRRRNNRQTIMVGFSDGTKDGGYLMANWSIYKAKEELTAISHSFGVDVVFFDGRGGPPARGGGKTHKFYASMGRNISNKEIQLTIQGQTVSSNFGNVEAARYNIEQLLHAGILNGLQDNEVTLSAAEHHLLQEMADLSFEKYKELKNHPYFFEYLAHTSPINFYSETNIGSRPAKRGKSSAMNLKEIRAIPFVGAWSQLKQNVPGYYGFGAALRIMEERGKMADVKKLYRESLYFKTLVDNCEMAMKKSFFPLTAFLASHPKYGEIWNMIYEEYELTERYLFILSGHSELMADYPVEQLSIQMREKIVLPLVTIQQYAIAKIREAERANPYRSLRH